MSIDIRTGNAVSVLRFISISAVCLYHFFPELIANGYLGVSIFFFVSGFLVQSGFEEVNSNTYIFKRIFRLVPNFIIIYFIILVLCQYIPSSIFNFTTEQKIAAFIFNVDGYFSKTISYFSSSSRYNPILHLWSIGMEVKFYLVLYLLNVFKLKISHKYSEFIFKFFIFVFMAISLIYDIYMQFANPTSAYFNFNCRIWEFFAGAFCYLIFKNRYYSWLKYKFLNLSLFAILLLLLIVKFNFLISKVLVVLSVALVVYLGIAKSKQLINYFSNRTYQIYLSHYPVMVLIELKIVSVLMGMLFLLLILLMCEIGDLIRKKILINAKSITFVLLVYSGFVWAGIYTQLPSNVNGFSYEDPSKFWHYGECFVDNMKADFKDTCVKDNSDFLLIGDSHVAQLSQFFDKSASSHLYSQVAYGGCLPLMTSESMFCSKKIYDFISRKTILSHTKILFSVNLAYHEKEEIRKSFALLRSYFPGNNIYILYNYPAFSYSPQVYFWKNRENFSDEVNISIDKGMLLFPDLVYEDLLMDSADTYGMNLLDISKILCNENACNAGKIGYLFYADDNHLSSFGVNFIMSQLRF